MKNFIKTFAAGLASIALNISTVIASVMVVLGFSIIHKLTPWFAILFFIALLMLSGIAIFSIYLLGQAARGKIQLIGNKEKETEENKDD